MADEPEPIIRAAAGSASGTLNAANKGLANAIEAAMHRATEDAMANGISDPDEILALKLAARERVKAEARGEPGSDAETE